MMLMPDLDILATLGLAALVVLVYVKRWWHYLDDIL